MRRILVLIAASMLVLAACGGDDGEAASSGGGEANGASTEEATVAVESSDYGDILVDAEGRSLYMFVPDEQENGTPTCYDDCAEAWPALEATGDPVAGEGADQSLLGTAERTDGGQQVTYNSLPLYHFAGDEAAGDLNGQALGGVWWVMDPGGNAIEQRPTLGVSETDFGDVLVGDNGMTVYMFMPDQQENGTPTCYDDCEQAWPVVEATDSPVAGGGVDESLIGSVERDDGTQQLTYNDLPLYYFSGDKKVGQANGQGIEEVWWVMDAEGQPVEQAPQG